MNTSNKYNPYICVPDKHFRINLLSPVAGSWTVSTPFPLFVTWALTAPLSIVAVPRHGAELVLIGSALIIFQVDATAVLGARLNLLGQAGSACLPLPIVLRVAPLQRYTGRWEK